MKLTTLIENSTGDIPELQAEHGLSMLIEDNNSKILFDTGKTGAIVDNSKILGINLNDIDILVLSHAHYDHCGGVKKLLETYNIKPKLIIGKNFFENSDKYHYSDKVTNLDFAKKIGYTYVGIDFDKKYLENKGIEIIEASSNGIMKISDNVFVFSNFEKKYDFETQVSAMQYIKDGKYVTDTFEEEIALGIKTNDGLYILLGCAHPGFLNMVKTIEERTGEKIAGIIGGTHLSEANDERINKSIEELKKMNVKVLGLSHCTGEKAVNMLKTFLPDLFINKTGTVFELYN